MEDVAYKARLRLGIAGTERRQVSRSDRMDAAVGKQIQVLQERNGELAAFAHTVAHNLKNPLSVIIGTCDVISHISELSGEELHEYVEQIRVTAYDMDEMIYNLLLLSEAGAAKVPAQELDMAGIVGRTLGRLASLIQQHGAEISHPEYWPGAVGYAPWIEDVWSNLISNAVKYGGQPPRVELGAVTRPDGTVLFWVRDNGAGLSPEAQLSLFRPFNQFGPVRVPGHGLGLSIVRRIVERLGGQVGVETEAGKGSQFFFTLPSHL